MKIDVVVNVAAILHRSREDAEKHAQRAVKEAAEELEAATPVDTGEAASSWFVKREIDGSISIKNDEEYVKYLNAGSSKQAPSNFIERIVLQLGKANGPVVDYK